MRQLWYSKVPHASQSRPHCGSEGMHWHCTPLRHTCTTGAHKATPTGSLTGNAAEHVKNSAALQQQSSVLTLASLLPHNLLLRWAKGEVGPGATDLNTKFRDPERFDFYTNDRAKQYYENYVKQIVNRYK